MHANVSCCWEGDSVTDGEPQANPAPRPERVPAMQRLLDNPFLLLFLGVTIPAVLYILWGVMEIVSIPIAK
jgi:hypothetical protein